MDTALFLLLGIAIGAALCYFAQKVAIQKKYAPKTELDAQQDLLESLKNEIATRTSKDELERNYVSKQLYSQLIETLGGAKKELEEEKKETDNQRQIVLSLTAVSEQKLTKEEVEKKYTPRETLELIKGKLEKTEKTITEQNQTILDLNTSLTELRKQEEGLNEKLSTFKVEVEALHTLSQQQFKNIAADILEEKSKAFVETNKTELSSILGPLKTDLSTFQTKVEDTRKEDIRDLTSLKNEIASLQTLNTRLSEDAQDLANALKADVKVQGDWGEDRLKLILELEGMQKYIDYTSQTSYRDEETDKNRKPDFILNMPDDKHIIIDSKVSLTAYVNYFRATSSEEKKRCLDQHIESITKHIDYLAGKNYQDLVGLNSPGYVFMFMPIDAALTLAVNEKPEIFNRALSKNIVIITPTTLVATLKIVRLIWQKENRLKNVDEIFKQCGLLYDKFATFAEELLTIGDALSNATASYHGVMDRLKDGPRKGDTILGRFETIKKLEARAKKKVPDKLLAEVDLLEENDLLFQESSGGELPLLSEPMTID